MAYADYEYYAGTYMGNVCESDFQRLALRASTYLDYFTQNRAKDHPDMNELKLCCCALVDKYSVIEAAQELTTKRLLAAGAADADVKSETVGAYSRTLSSGGEAATAALGAIDHAQSLLAETCRAYLSHTGLLYRGGARCTLPTL